MDRVWAEDAHHIFNLALLRHSPSRAATVLEVNVSRIFFLLSCFFLVCTLTRPLKIYNAAALFIARPLCQAWIYICAKQ